MNSLKAYLSFTLTTVTFGCEEAVNTDTGTVTFTAWGEEYIEDGIPADDFEDGWSVVYDRFLMVLSDVRADGRDGTQGGGVPQSQCLDLSEPGPHELGTIELRARAWDRVGYQSLEATTETIAHSSASDADRELLLEEGYSVYVSGTASRGEESKTFAWGFSGETAYRDCQADIDGKQTLGFVLPRAGSAVVELTLHGDHLFYDDLASQDAKLRFDPIALADSDSDGNVTLEELREVALVDILDGPYGTGSFSDVNDLGAFVAALTATLGHFRGEGHCTSTVL